MKSLTTNSISSVHRFHAALLKAHSQLNVLNTKIYIRTQTGLFKQDSHEFLHCHSTEHISRSSAHVALIRIAFKPPSQVNWSVWELVFQKISQVFNDSECVIVCFEKPVCVA